MAPPRRKPSPALARAHAAAASRARRQHARRRGPVRAPPDSDSSKQTVHSCHSISGPLLQRRKHSEQGGCGDAACGSWPASDSASSNISAAVSQTACKRGSAGKQLVEAGLRAIGISVQQILFIPHFSQTSASAAINPVTRVACNQTPRPDSTSRATLHALHMSTRAAFKL